MVQPNRAKREGGAALLMSMLMLVLMGMIGLASLDTVMRDRQVAGFQSLSQTALYAADAAVSEGLDIVRRDIVGSALAPGDCLPTTVPARVSKNLRDSPIDLTRSW